MRTFLRRPYPVRIMAVMAALACAVLPPAGSQASGIIWLPVQQATQASFAHLHPSLASYHDHAYILTTSEPGGDAASVHFTTNESGSWKTETLSTAGPTNAYSAEFSALTVDAGTGKLYAIWIYKRSADTYALGVWTRDASHHWIGPADIASSGFLGGKPAVVADGGKVYVAYIDSATNGACNDLTTRAGDVQLVTFDGNAWSTPQNLTSCVPDPNASGFEDPKLAVDPSGHAYLVARANNGNLWYADTAGGSWSNPQQITNGVDVEDTISSPAFRDTYGMTASDGVVYVAYAQFLTINGANNGSDIFLLTHAVSGAWSSPQRISPPDPGGCAKWGISLTTPAGRLGIAYVMASSGGCHGNGPAHITPYLFTGTPDRLTAIRVDGGKDCGDTTLAAERNLFRLVLSCGGTAPSGSGNLYYWREYLDTVPPKVHLSARAANKTIYLQWNAQDPSPGAGVAAYELEMRHGRSAWRTISTHSNATSLVYHAVSHGGMYAFRVRARDRVNNWSTWANATVHLH